MEIQKDMKNERLLILVLVPSCDVAGNGDGDSRNPKSKSSSDSYRDGWERTFARTKNLNVN